MPSLSLASAIAAIAAIWIRLAPIALRDSRLRMDSSMFVTIRALMASLKDMSLAMPAASRCRLEEQMLLVAGI